MPAGIILMVVMFVIKTMLACLRAVTRIACCVLRFAGRVLLKAFAVLAAFCLELGAHLARKCKAHRAQRGGHQGRKAAAA